VLHLTGIAASSMTSALSLKILAKGT
jgi:hypothetical protein